MKNNNNIFTLNQMVFNDILPYLIYKRQFYEILNLSLISKQSFKIIQNIIVQGEIKLNLGSLASFKQYIEKCNNNINNYNYKLIQFKEIKSIRLSDYKENIIKIDWNYRLQPYSLRLKDYKLYFQNSCSKLKEINLIKDTLSTHFSVYDLEFESQDIELVKEAIENYNFDYTLNGFYRFDTLWTEATLDFFPISNYEEYYHLYQDQSYIDLDNYPYSFEYIKNYNTRKFKLVKGVNMQINIFNQNNILKFKSIESLDIQLPLDIKFLRNAFKCSNLKSLYFVYRKDDEEDISTVTDEEDSDGDTEGEVSIHCHRHKRLSTEFKGLISAVQDGLSQNTTLKKLVMHFDYNKFVFKNPVHLFEAIKSSGNTTLNQLGLSHYFITKSILLKPLLDIPSITKLLFSTSFHININLKSFNCYLNHIKENINITHFKCILLFKMASYDQILNRLSQLFQEIQLNDRTLNITLVVLVKIKDIDKHSNRYDSDSASLFQKLKQSNNSQFINLKIKYQLDQYGYNYY